MYLRIKKINIDENRHEGSILISYRRYNQTKYRWIDFYKDCYGDYTIEFNGVFSQEDDDYLEPRFENIIYLVDEKLTELIDNGLIEPRES